jgi:dolichol-phosphate mannosyltransferase
MPDCQGRPDRFSIVLVLYDLRDQAVAQQALRGAKKALDGLAVDYEILVIGAVGSDAVKEIVLEEAVGSGRIRYGKTTDPGSYRQALHIGLAASTASHLVISNGSVDFSALRYVLPLAEQHALVYGYRYGRGESLLEQCKSWVGNRAAQLFMGTRVRDCRGGTCLSVLERSAATAIMPDTDGPFCHAEILARANGLDLSVAEAPIKLLDALSTRLPSHNRPRLRDWFKPLQFWWRLQYAATPATLTGKMAAVLGLVLAVLALVLLFPDNHPLFEPDEGRQAEIAREMLVHDDLLLPRIQGNPYYEKPPLQYWLTAGMYSLLGVRPWVARLVPAAAAWLTILLTYCWGLRAIGPRRAFLGGLALCLSFGFVLVGRTVILDSLLVCCVAASWYAAHTAMTGPEWRWSWWLGAALACGLGILTKGPVALVLFVPPVAFFSVVAGDIRRPGKAPWVLFLLIALAVPAPWYLAMAWRDSAYLEQFFWKANIVRFLQPYDHKQPWWFYLPILFMGMFPWSLLALVLGPVLFSRKPSMASLRTPGLGFSVLTGAWCLLFFSLSGCKSPPYVLPTFAPLALVFGVCLDAVLFLPVRHCSHWFEHARRILPRRAAIAILVLAESSYAIGALLSWQPLNALIVPLLLIPIVAWTYWRYGQRLAPLLNWGLCGLSCMAFILFPARDLGAGYAAQHSPETIVRMIRHWPGHHQSPVVSIQREWQSASFYLRRLVIGYYGGHIYPDLVSMLRKNPEVLVLIENGENLEVFLRELPLPLEKEVIVPDPDGNVALVVVRMPKDKGSGDMGQGSAR